MSDRKIRTERGAGSKPSSEAQPAPGESGLRARVRSQARYLLSHRDLLFYLVLLSLVGLGLAFLTLSRSIGSPPIDFDTRLLLLLREPGTLDDPLGPPWVADLFTDITTLGSGLFVAVVCCVVVGYLVLVRHGRTALVFTTCIVLAALSVYFFKDLFERPRPGLIMPAARLQSYSFPSGHSTISAAVYPTLGALLARVVSRRRLKIYCMSVAMLATFGVGVSRVYLGVHYPTDVLAGWSIGLAWSLVCWVLLRRMQRRGLVETEPVDAPGGDAPGGDAPGGNAPGGNAPGGNAPGGDAPGKNRVED